MKLTLVLSFVVVSQLKCFDSIRNIGVAISKVIESYYVEQNLAIDIIVNGNSSEVNDLLDKILGTVKSVTAPRIIKMDD